MQPDKSRPGQGMAATVEAGIALAAEGRDGALAYLIAHRVPDAVIARVLCEPARRRPALPVSDSPQ